MATVSGEDVKHMEKATLKRKLTGPPRLLLGKAKTRSVEDRPEAQTHKDKMAGGDESPLTRSDNTEWTDPANMVLSDMSCKGGSEAAGEDDITNRKVNRHRWWRGLSPAVVCKRRQKSNVKDTLEKKKNTDCVPPEGALQETDSAAENVKATKGKMRFKARMFKMFPSLSNSRLTHEQKRGVVDHDSVEPSLTFCKKMQRFFSRGGVSRHRGVPQNMEAPSLSAARAHEPSELHSHETVQSVEVEMVLTEKQAAARGPERTPTEDHSVTSVNEEDLMAAVNRSKMVPINVLKEVTSPETDKDFCAPTKVILDADNQVSTSSTSPKEAREVHREKTDETTPHLFQPSTNEPSIRIELVPPDDVVQEDGEEACWDGSSSSENHNHLLLLLGFEPSERQLVQMARSLVRAAVNAAVDQLSRDQLSRDQQSDSDCIHRDLLSCRDHT